MSALLSPASSSGLRTPSFGVGTFRDVGNPGFFGRFDDPAEDHALAVVTAVRRIVTDAVKIQCFRRNDDLPDAGVAAESGSLLLLSGRDKGRGGRHGEGAVSQNIVRDLQQKGRVHAAGKGDGEAAQLQKPAAERVIFCMQCIHR